MVNLFYSFSNLKHLELLDLSNQDDNESGNKFTDIPEAVKGMSSLNHLSLSNMSSLESLNHQILKSLARLTNLECTECPNMHTPPSSVAKQGLQAVMTYYVDLQHGQAKQVPPIIVIGKAMAGKTSIVQSITKRERVCTKRTSENQRETATRVFQSTEATINANRVLRFIDLGGQQLYHLAYRLMFKRTFVPLVVVNMQEFDQIAEASEDGIGHATKELCMDWLVHLYLACPKLGKPTLVLTHKDRLTREKFDLRKDELIKGIEALRKAYIEDAERVPHVRSVVNSVELFFDRDENMIDQVFSLTNGEEVNTLRQLEDKLMNRCDANSIGIPDRWAQACYYFEASSESYILLVSYEHEFRDPEHTMLRHLHDSGKLLWFERIPELRPYIFHDCTVISDAIGLLFDHCAGDKWDQLISKFRPFTSAGVVIELDRFKSLVSGFQSSGLMNRALLESIFSLNNSKLPFDLCYTIFEIFNLLCPVTEKKTSKVHYMFPAFSQTHIKVNMARGYIPFRCDVLFPGLPLSRYIYDIVVANFINYIVTRDKQVVIGNNGAQVMTEHIRYYLLHFPNESKLTLTFFTHPRTISDAWGALLDILKHILTNLKCVWEALRFSVVFHCAHCTLRGSKFPNTHVDPSWFTLKDGNMSRPDFSSETDFDSTCYKEKVPKPLLFPCMYNKLYMPAFLVAMVACKHDGILPKIKSKPLQFQFALESVARRHSCAYVCILSIGSS